MKPMLITPITPMMRAAVRASRLCEKIDTARVQPARISTHSSTEPSCPPHTAQIR